MLTEADIHELVVPNAGQSFNGNDFRDLLSPGVYVFLKDDIPLYVGMSKRLLGRIGNKHSQAALAIIECTKVLIYPCRSVDRAKKLELFLISRMKPKYNVNRGGYFKTFLGITNPYGIVRSLRVSRTPEIT